MSFTLNSDNDGTSRGVLLAVAAAIKALEAPQGTIKQYGIVRDDDYAYTNAKRLLWGILEAHNCTIDVDTNRLTKAVHRTGRHD